LLMLPFALTPVSAEVPMMVFGPVPGAGGGNETEKSSSVSESSVLDLDPELNEQYYKVRI